MSLQWTETIRRSYRPEVALRHVAAVSQYHRIQASPGFRGAAEYVAAELAAAGLQVEIKRYPADGQARFWSTPSFLEWECRSATLQLLDGDNLPVETLCDFAAVPISVIQRSVPVEGDFEVVALPDNGAAAIDCDGIAVRGRLLLTGQAPGRLVEPAVSERGAAGFLFDGMRAGGRSELDLPDARQYTSFWWPGPRRPEAFGFVLSPRQGQALRARLAGGAPVRIRARIDARFYSGWIEVVEAYLPGTEIGDAETFGQAPGRHGSEVLLVSHLCHPQPGAHDNGSGVAALMEAAATLARLVDAGNLPRPRRGIRFIWPPEMTGTVAWLAEHEAGLHEGRWLAGLNLDMVGADQNATGSVWELVGLPEAAPAFADHLLAWLREPFLDGQRHCEAKFTAGSDHYILSDPTVGIPTPMLNQWPDRYYHTSGDTLDKVSANSLGRSGALAAVYAYWLAVAGPEEARWLGHWMVGRFQAAALGAGARAAETLRRAEEPEAREVILREYLRRNGRAAERMAAALETLERIDSSAGAELGAWREQVRQAAAVEAAWVHAVAGAGEARWVGDIAAREAGAWREEAATRVPLRRGLGPVDVGMAVRLCGYDLQRAWAELQDAYEPRLNELGPLLQYWADGRRTLIEIANEVGLETGEELPADLPVRYFSLLEQAGFVEMRAAGRP